MKLQQAKFHFVGVGGIGMCGLAELLKSMGAQVTGSDLVENVHIQRLKKQGVKIFLGHQAQNIGDSDVVVYSSAVPRNNPEIIEALAKKIPLIPRAEALAEIMRLKRGIAVAGTHGKTTTTSLVSSLFFHTGLNPTIFVGGRLDLINSTAQLGQGEWLIAEADESDGSFNKLSPEIAIITNIDHDHLDHFKDFENLQRAFYDFALKVPFYGLTVACGDDAHIKNVFKNFPKRILFYGFNEDNDIILKGKNGNYQIFQKENFFKTQGMGQMLCELKMPLPGLHNGLNACAAAIVGFSAGLTSSQVQMGLEKFQGVDRRFQKKGEFNQIQVFDDYGHHPTEIRATLQAFKEKFPNQRLVVYFQPHRYSRTENCWNEFLTCFDQADLLFLGAIYPAGETPIPHITSERLFAEIKHKNKFLIDSHQEASRLILSHLKSQDIFATLGAGDGWKIGQAILDSKK